MSASKSSAFFMAGIAFIIGLPMAARTWAGSFPQRLPAEAMTKIFGSDEYCQNVFNGTCDDNAAAEIGDVPCDGCNAGNINDFCVCCDGPGFGDYQYDCGIEDDPPGVDPANGITTSCGTILLGHCMTVNNITFCVNPLNTATNCGSVHEYPSQ